MTPHPPFSVGHPPPVEEGLGSSVLFLPSPRGEGGESAAADLPGEGCRPKLQPQTTRFRRFSALPSHPRVSR